LPTLLAFLGQVEISKNFSAKEGNKMLYVNTRHQLPQIAIRQQWGKFDAAAAVPATVHTNDEQAKSNKGATQSSIDIDNYPSRKAYGARNMTDYSAELAQRGLADAQSGISKRTQTAWTKIENAAKKGNDIPQQYKSQMMSKYSKVDMLVQFNLMPAPEITAHESQVVGEPDEGDVTAEIEPVYSPNVQYTPGSAETYLADKGFIRHWVSEGHYDIYA